MPSGLFTQFKQAGDGLLVDKGKICRSKRPYAFSRIVGALVVRGLASSEFPDRITNAVEHAVVLRPILPITCHLFLGADIVEIILPARTILAKQVSASKDCVVTGTSALFNVSACAAGDLHAIDSAIITFNLDEI
ncbi:MAG: hypothetical protein M9905_12120 [Rhizobiaceae bacterium]|nr:hypothetical protein [Rhizobiaceae bacterium]